MKNARKLGLVGRCLLAGGMLIGGCYDPIHSTKEHIKFFTCSYWKDLNKDYKTIYPDEFIGIKNKFKKDEKMELTLDMPILGIKGREIIIIIYDPKGNPVLASSTIMPNDVGTIRFGANTHLVNNLVEKGGFGKYNAVAYVGSATNMFSHEFEITE